VKTTYTATVKSPDWCTVLMSALSDDVAGKAKGMCKWRQPVPTSAYLIAFAAGNLDSRDIRYRHSVITEPS
jgi:aminopeptidase N